jgi:hypothetical protein
MSQTGFPSKWFLELDGKRMGPFAPEQVLGLLADGEIPENLKVYPDPKLGTLPGFEGSMTASALREAYYHDDRIPSAPVLETQPAAAEIPYAPDPNLSSEISSAQAQSEQDLVTARRLFDLFQSAKEKRAARFAPSSSSPIPSGTARSSGLRGISAAAAALICALGVWALTQQPSGNGPDREIAAETKKASHSNPSIQSALSAQAELAKEVSKPMTSPTHKAKPAIRNSWKPGKALTKVAPPPREERRDDPRDERRDDFRDERNLDQWNQAQEPAPAQAPLLNQMSADAGLQPPPAPPPVDAPSVPMDGMPQEPQQNNGFTEQPAQ